MTEATVFSSRMPKGYRRLFCSDMTGAMVKFHLLLGKPEMASDGNWFRQFVFGNQARTHTTTLHIWGDRSRLTKSREAVGRLEVFISNDGKHIEMHLDMVDCAVPTLELMFAPGVNNRLPRGGIHAHPLPGLGKRYELIDLARLCCTSPAPANDGVDGMQEHEAA